MIWPTFTECRIEEGGAELESVPLEQDRPLMAELGALDLRAFRALLIRLSAAWAEARRTHTEEGAK